PPSRRSGAMARREGGRTGALQDASRIPSVMCQRASVLDCGGPPPLFILHRSAVRRSEHYGGGRHGRGSWLDPLAGCRAASSFLGAGYGTHAFACAFLFEPLFVIALRQEKPGRAQCSVRLLLHHVE